MTPVPYRVLSYQCQLIIIANMNANQRIHSSMRCPTIRTMEKSIPFKIATIALRPLELELNGHLYEIDFLRRDHVIKESLLMNNEAERLQFPDTEYFGPRKHLEYLRHAESVVMQKQKEFEDLLSKTNEELLDIGMSKEFVEKKIEMAKVGLIIIRYKLGVLHPQPFTDYLVLCESGRVGEYLDYTCSVWDVMGHLVKRIFNGRGSVKIGHLIIDAHGMSEEKFQRKIKGLRIPSLSQQILDALPVDFRLQIDNLELKTPRRQLTDPMLPYTKSLTIHRDHNVRIMRNLSHKKVYWTQNIQQFLEFAKTFGEQEWEIGTQWTCDFELGSDLRVEIFFDVFPSFMKERRPDVKVRVENNDDTLYFPIRYIYKSNNTSEVHMYCKRQPNGHSESLTMVLEVLPIGTKFL